MSILEKEIKVESAAELARLQETEMQLRKQLVQSEKLATVGQIAAGVAHEINNPVGFVLSNLGTLGQYLDTLVTLIGLYKEREGVAEEQANAMLKKIHALEEQEDLEFLTNDSLELIRESITGMERIKEIVQGLKGFSRVNDADPKLASINDGIEATLKVIQNELKYKCEVVKSFGDLPLTVCKISQLNQVFMNLLVNGAQAIEEFGKITIETESGDGWITIKISDSGSGIPEGNLETIFEPFFTTKPEGKGTGLGLAISAEIVRDHGGEVLVESELNKGTTFFIRLPVREASDE